MKKIFACFVCTGFLALFSACNSGTTEEVTTEDSTTTGVTANNDQEGANATMNADESNRSYKDLYTGSTIKVHRDAATGRYVNAETNSVIEYYYDPATSDTFDASGRVVNMALIRGADGKYTVDEAKVKFQSDGDMKMKSADGETKVKLETNGDGKIKNASGKVKVKDGEVEVKE